MARCNPVKTRLRDAYGDDAKYQVIGEPTTVEDANDWRRRPRISSKPGPWGWWEAASGRREKGADKGIDGRLYFHDGTKATRQIILSVKAGKLHANYVRDLRGVMEREKADLAVLLSFDKPTKPMRAEAASAGFYSSSWGQFPRLQLLTVEELLAGKGIDYPRVTGANQTYKIAPRPHLKVAEKGL